MQPFFLRSPLIRLGCMFCGQEPGAPRNNSTCTPSPGITLTFAEAAEMARRSSAGQQKVGLWCFERRDPSIIIPNHPAVHPNALLTPTASTHSYCPCTASRSMVGVEGGGRSSSRAQDHHIFSCGRGSSRGLWWWWTLALFPRSRSSFGTLASRFFAAKRLGRGSGGLACAGQTL